MRFIFFVQKQKRPLLRLRVQKVVGSLLVFLCVGSLPAMAENQTLLSFEREIGLDAFENGQAMRESLKKRFEQGEYARAELLGEAVLQSVQMAQIAALLDLAHIAAMQKKLDQLDHYVDKLIALTEAAYGKDSGIMLTVVNACGVCYELAGKSQKAMELEAAWLGW